jgi:hypothetical protein
MPQQTAVANIQHVTLWCLVSSLRRNSFTNPHSVLCKVNPESELEASTTITALRRELGVTFDSDVRFKNYPIVFKTCHESPIVSADSLWSSIFRRTLSRTIETSMLGLNSANYTTPIRRVCEGISLWDACHSEDDRATDRDLRLLRLVLCPDNRAQTQELDPGIRQVALSTALRRAKVTVADDRKKLSKSSILALCHSTHSFVLL